MIQRVNISITAVGWSYLTMLAFIIAGAVIRDINLLYIMAGMMLGPMLFSLYAATRSLRRLSLERKFPTLVGVGDPLFVEVQAAKPKSTPRAFAVVVEDRVSRAALRGRATSEKAKLFLASVPAGGRTDVSYRVRLLQRGRYELGPMRVSTSMPLGLIRASATGPNTEEVLVSPQLGRLLPAWSRRLELKNDGGQKSMRRPGKREGDFYGMREWRDGDSRHWIHWRTSAKRNKLAVRQFEQRINQDLVVILDLFRDQMHSSPSNVVEEAISFAATLALEHGKHGSTHLMVASVSRSEFFIQGTSSPVFHQGLLERLAMVDPTGEDRLASLLSEVLPKAAPTSKVVVITTRPLDLRDTQQYEELWSHKTTRRLMSDVVCVNTAASEFQDWFQSAKSMAAASATSATSSGSATTSTAGVSRTAPHETEDAENADSVAIGSLSNAQESNPE